MHGFSLNVKDCNDGFSLINPCGYAGIEMTSMENERKISFDMDNITVNLVKRFCEVFGYCIPKLGTISA